MKSIMYKLVAHDQNEKWKVNFEILNFMGLIFSTPVVRLLFYKVEELTAESIYNDLKYSQVRSTSDCILKYLSRDLFSQDVILFTPLTFWHFSFIKCNQKFPPDLKGT